MKGEELDKMSIAELQQLENKLEEGLSRVLNRKVLKCVFTFFNHLIALHVIA
jgi:K-box region